MYAGFLLIISFMAVVFPEQSRPSQTINLPFVRWLGDYESFTKLTAQQIETLAKSATSIPNKFKVHFHSEKSRDDAEPYIRKLGGEIIEEYKDMLVCNLPEKNLKGKLKRLAEIPGVKLIDTVEIMEKRCDVATKIMCVSEHPEHFKNNKTLNLPLTGEGEIIGIADSGLDTGNPKTIHEDFHGRIVGIKSLPIHNLSTTVLKTRGICLSGRMFQEKMRIT